TKSNRKVWIAEENSGYTARITWGVFVEPAQVGIANPDHLGRIPNLVFPNAANAVWKLHKGAPIRSPRVYILQEFAAQSQLRLPTITEIRGRPSNLGDSA